MKNFIKKYKKRIGQEASNLTESDTYKSVKTTAENVSSKTIEAVKSIEREDVEKVAKTAKVAWLKFDKDAKMALVVLVVTYFVASFLPLGNSMPKWIAVGLGGWYFVSAKMSSAGRD